MKILIFLSMCLCTSGSFAQSGYKLLEKASRQIEAGNYDKALALLEKAKGADYGFCGLAYMEAYAEIAHYRSQISEAKGDFAEAADFLNDSKWLFEIDSQKISLYIKAFGKERVKREIDSCLALIPRFTTWEQAPEELELPVSFARKPLLLDIYMVNYRLKPLGNVFSMDEWMETIKQQPFYTQLM